MPHSLSVNTATAKEKANILQSQRQSLHQRQYALHPRAFTTVFHGVNIANDTGKAVDKLRRPSRKPSSAVVEAAVTAFNRLQSTARSAANKLSLGPAALRQWLT